MEYNYMSTRVPRGHSSCSRGCANKLLIIIKRFLFTASKNINHSCLLNRLPQHVHVRVTMYPLTTILLITLNIIHYTHHRYYAHVLQHSNNIATIVYKRTENVTDTKPQIIYMMTGELTEKCRT